MIIDSGRRHLGEAGETYLQHLHAALGIALRLAQASAACALHAFVPGLCTSSASRTIAELQESMSRRASRAQRRRSRQAQQGSDGLGVRVVR